MYFAPPKINGKSFFDDIIHGSIRLLVDQTKVEPVFRFAVWETAKMFISSPLPGQNRFRQLEKSQLRVLFKESEFALHFVIRIPL